LLQRDTVQRTFPSGQSHSCSIIDEDFEDSRHERCDLTLLTKRNTASKLKINRTHTLACCHFLMRLVKNKQHLICFFGLNVCTNLPFIRRQSSRKKLRTYLSYFQRNVSLVIRDKQKVYDG
jgi:hypothetical protein